MIGSTLKQLLAEKRMTVGELSRRVDVPAQTLYSIIRRDNMTIDFDVLLRICSALDVPVDVFVRDARAGAASDPADWVLLGKLRALDASGRALAETVIDHELDRVRATAARTRVIPLSRCRASPSVRRPSRR